MRCGDAVAGAVHPITPGRTATGAGKSRLAARLAERLALGPWRASGVQEGAGFVGGTDRHWSTGDHLRACTRHSEHDHQSFGNGFGLSRRDEHPLRNCGLVPLDRWIGRLRRAGRDWAADRGGAAAVEFALTIVPFLMLLFLICQVGLYFFSQQSLDYATRSAARQVMIGSVQAQGMSASQFKTGLLCPALRMPLDCAKITVSLSQVAKTSDANTDTGIYAFMQQSVPSLNPANLDASKGSFCAGAPGDYIFIDVAYKFPIFVDVSKLSGSNSAMNPMVLRSTAFVANEPYHSASGSTGAGC